MDKLKQLYSLFLGHSIVLFSSFKLSIGPIVLITNIIKLDTEFI